MFTDPMEHDRTSAFERFRPYLTMLARTHLQPQVRAKVDASDIVQQTLITAHRRNDQFQGGSDGEMAAWLRQILAHCLATATRDLSRAKRDARRERSIQAELDASSACLKNCLVAASPSPSFHIQQEEQAVQVASALAELPESQRDVLVLKHCRGLSLIQVAEALDRSVPSVTSLLQRGYKNLRQALQKHVAER